jgi:CRP-like cAMP-binding protein
LSKEAQKVLLEKIKAVPLFSGLKDKQLKTILASGKRMAYPEGKLIEREGENGVAFYLILDGAVEVKRKGRVLAKLGAGDFFGEMSLIDRAPRSSDVVTAMPTSCLVLSSWTFISVVRTNNDLALNLLKTLVHRLRESDKALSD